jgi:transposase
MSRPRRVDMDLVGKAQALAAQATTLEELRCAQAVLIPALLDATLEETAAVLGVGRATAARYQSRLRDRVARPQAAAPQWGGRRHAAMSLEEEREFLQPWRTLSAEGGMLVVSPLRAALAQRLGHPVAASVVYRMLARHGWRKVAPDTKHPKSDPSIQEDWKKNSPPHWRPC